MEAIHRASAETMRARIVLERLDPSDFRSAVMGVPSGARDAWLDLVLGLDGVPDDGPELPRGCVPYLPCSADALLRVVDQARVCASDVFVDVGCGPGRAAAFVHLLTGAGAIGIEIQPALALAARDLVRRLPALRVACVQGDALKLTRFMTIGSVFFLYCPFSGDRLKSVLYHLEAIARTRSIRVCCVDLPLPPCAWLVAEPALCGAPVVYRSVLRETAPPTGAAS